MGAHYLLKHTRAGCDPLSPDNVLCLMTGVLTGTAISGQSRMTATAKSPVTGLIGDSQSGGYWPSELKHAGFDGLVIHGRAEAPCWLWICDGIAELRDAANLWGRVTGDVVESIAHEIGCQAVQILQSGPAAERGVLYGALISSAALSGATPRANGRTGMGTVMASKNLKAVAVRGTGEVEVKNVTGLRQLSALGGAHLATSDVAGLKEHGTAEGLLPLNEEGGLPTRNWSSGVFEGAEEISGERMTETVLKRRATCAGCVIGCKRIVEIDEGPWHVDPLYGGPEYETLAAMGSYCGVSDLAAICRANQLCNMYGMDTISCGATIAWAMDCYERGLLTDQHTDGMEVRFGNAESLLGLVENIAKREGLGRYLGLGAAGAAEALGIGGELVMATKRLEFPAHMPQHKRSLALIYAVNPFGADHQSHEHDPFYSAAYGNRMGQLGLLGEQPQDVLDAEKVRYALYTQFFYSATDSVCVCQFVFGPSFQLYDPGQLAEAISHVTGWRFSLWELMKVGERRLNLLRVFNAREGVGREQDATPPLLHVPLSGGPTDGVSISIEQLNEAQAVYYRMAGWDAQGRPLPGKLEELGLGWTADGLPVRE